jgi:hypothetical protein
MAEKAIRSLEESGALDEEPDKKQSGGSELIT